MKYLLVSIALLLGSLSTINAQTLLECSNSRTNARITFESKVGDIINLKVYWDEGSTFSGAALNITNGECVSCPRVGGIGRPHGTEKTYQIRQIDPNMAVSIAWASTGYCGNEAAQVPGTSPDLICNGSATGAKITFESKVGDILNLKVYWDEGATFGGAALNLTNGECVSCPRVGGIGRPHGTEKDYQIRQIDSTQQVIIKWAHAYCGTDQSLVID